MRPTVVARIGHAPCTRRRSADVVVVGSGAAGMVAALVAADAGRRVELVTKTALGEGSSRWAQGGIAAAIDPADSPAAHAEDTMVAGAGLCDPGVVEALTGVAGATIARLSAWGVRFDTVNGHLALGREGGHRRARIVHAGGDATGAEVVRALREQVRNAPIAVEERCVALELCLGPRGAASGLVVAGLDAAGALREVTEIATETIVLATGGLGQAFSTTSNPVEATGDGLALAARAGAYLRHLELVQFHPTVLYQPGATGQRPLLTEALRGAGAVIRDARGASVLAGVHPLGDLAPRDVVAGAMARHLLEHGEDALFLDCLGIDDLERRFPTVVAACRAAGYEPTREWLPIRPAAHYSCGGIEADLDGRTSVPGLLAIGEVAATGAHGANRLASNSLLEAVVAGARAGALLGRDAQGPRDEPRATGPSGASAKGADEVVDAASRQAIAAATERGAGVLRSTEGLLTLIGELGAVERRSAPARDLDTVEATNLHTVSTLLASAALARGASRGCHQRVDGPARPGLDVAAVRVRVGPDGAVQVEALPGPAGAQASALEEVGLAGRDRSGR